MTKTNDHDTEAHDLIDLGAASAETKGGTQIHAVDNGQLSFRQPTGMSED